MERIEDILQNLARQRGRVEGGPLALLRTVPGTPGERVTHVPISQQLYEAWLKLNSGPFRPHQSLALASLRRGEPVALRGASPANVATARLLLYEALRTPHGVTGLLLVASEEEAHAQFNAFSQLNAALSRPLPVAVVDDATRPTQVGERQLLITTPGVLHHRLLRHYDRGWQRFWSGLRVVCVSDVHNYSGVAGAHLAALLLRTARLRPIGGPLQLVATLADVAGAEDALAALWPQPWRLVPCDDGPLPPTLLAVWRGGDRLREAAALALALQRNGGCSVHISCPPLELPVLRALVGDESGSTTLGVAAQPADVQLLAGLPGSVAALQQALRSGAKAAVLVLGELPAEKHVAQRPELLLDETPPAWVVSAANIHVLSEHLLCAASEMPLTLPEVQAWQATELVERLERHGRLAQLPGLEPAWQPRVDVSGEQADCYTSFGLQTAGGPPAQLCDERGQVLGTLEAAAFDRWGFVGATLPPGRSRYRVVARDDERAVLTLRSETAGRRTYPLRRCSVTVREERATRPLRGGRMISWGRVTIDEEIYGYREVQQGAAPAERALKPPLTGRWAAHALWFAVDDTLSNRGHLAGWSLVSALPLRAQASLADLVPAYHADERRLYLVDAQPGGTGLATWAYEHLDELLPLAYDIVLACSGDALLEPLARADKDWLLLLLRPETRPVAAPLPVAVEVPTLRPRSPAAHEAPLLQELLAAPPLARQVVPEQPTTPHPPDVRALRVEASALPLARPPEPAPTPPEQTVRPVAPLLPPVAPPEPEPPATPAAGGARTSSQRPSEESARRGSGQRKGGAARGREKGKRGAAPPAPPEQEPPAPVLPVAESPPAVASSPLTEPPAPAEQPPLADASAMIARMRRLREERERRNGATQHPRSIPNNSEPLESRFSAGETVFCLPYGNGVVRESRIEEGQELLVVEFPEYGPLTIDPAVSLVRSVTAAPEPEDAG